MRASQLNPFYAGEPWTDAYDTAPTCSECDRAIWTRSDTVAVLSAGAAPHAIRFQPMCRACADALDLTDRVNSPAEVWPNGIGFDRPAKGEPFAHWHFVIVLNPRQNFGYHIAACYFADGQGPATCYAEADSPMQAFREASRHA